MHNALCASIYRFSNDGPHFEAKIVDPQKLAKVASLSQHRKLCHDIVLFVLQLFVMACNAMLRQSSVLFSGIMS